MIWALIHDDDEDDDEDDDDYDGDDDGNIQLDFPEDGLCPMKHTSLDKNTK